MTDSNQTPEDAAAAAAAAQLERRQALAARLLHLEQLGRFASGGSATERVAARLRGRRIERAERDTP